MSLPEVNDHAIASFRRFYSLLPRTTDAALTVLNIHLLVEEQVRAFVDERVRMPASVKSARLDCYQAICLAEALSDDDIHPQIWEAARKLNKLRNDVAHNLEPKGAIEQMRNVCAMFEPRPGVAKSTGNQDVLDELSFAASLMYNEISLHVKRKPADILQLVPNANSAP